MDPYRDSSVIRVNGDIFLYCHRTLVMSPNRWETRKYVILESFFFENQHDCKGLLSSKTNAETNEFLKSVALATYTLDSHITIEHIRKFLFGMLVRGSEWHGPVDKHFPEEFLLPAFIDGLTRRKFIAIAYEWPYRTAISSSDAGSPLEGEPIRYASRERATDDAQQIAGSEGTPRNNQAQNRQTRAVAKALGLTKRQARQLHEEISDQGLGYHDILERAQDMFGARE